MTHRHTHRTVRLIKARPRSTGGVPFCFLLLLCMACGCGDDAARRRFIRRGFVRTPWAWVRRGARPPVAARHAAAPAAIDPIDLSLAMISFRPVGATGTGAAPARDAFLFSVAPTLQGIKAASVACRGTLHCSADRRWSCSASFYPFHRRDACKGARSGVALDWTGVESLASTCGPPSVSIGRRGVMT